VQVGDQPKAAGVIPERISEILQNQQKLFTFSRKVPF